MKGLFREERYMGKILDRWYINIAFGLPPAIVYLTSFFTEGSRYDYNPIFWPANKLFPIFAISLAITAIYIQINFFRKAKRTLKICKIVFLAIMLCTVPLFYLAFTKGGSARFTILIILVLVLLQVSFVFNVMTKGARATNLTLVISSVVAFIIKTIISNMNLFLNVGNMGIDVIVTISIAVIVIPVGMFLLGILLDSSKSTSSRSNVYSPNSRSYSNSSYSSVSATNRSISYSSARTVDSNEISELKEELRRSKDHQYDLEKKELRDVEKYRREWQETLTRVNRGDVPMQFVNADVARKACIRNIEEANQKIKKIEAEIEYEKKLQKDIESKLGNP